jgi:hypothetical protein
MWNSVWTSFICIVNTSIQFDACIFFMITHDSGIFLQLTLQFEHLRHYLRLRRSVY